MRYGIFGDVHSNLEAFKEIIEAYKKQDIDEYFCVGDIVGYGANPRECIEEIKRLKTRTTCGNHDWASVGVFSMDYFNPAARSAVKWTQEKLTQAEKEFLKNLELVIDEGNFSIVHGSLCRPGRFPYILDTGSAYRCFQRMEKELCFVGHSHMSAVFWLEEDKIKYTFENFVKIKPGIKYIINVGSVGQPRDNNSKAAFCIFDTDKKTIEIKRVDYDTEGAKNKILKAGLPESLGYRLLKGQ